VEIDDNAKTIVSYVMLQNKKKKNKNFTLKTKSVIVGSQIYLTYNHERTTSTSRDLAKIIFSLLIHEKPFISI